MNLYQFIKDLSPEELKVIEPAFRKRKSSAGEKASEEKFIQLVLNTPGDELSDQFLQEALGKNENAYQKLKGRVLSKVLDKICSAKFMDNEEIIDGPEKAKARVKKKLLLISILNGKKSKAKPDLFLHLVNEVIEEAKEYELYNSLAEALTYRKHYFANRSGYRDFEKMEAEIEFYRECANAANTANNYYYKIISNQKLIAHLSEQQLNAFIDSAVHTLESSPYTTISTRIQYFYKIIKLAQAQKDGKHSEAVDICLDLINLLNRSKAVRQSDRYGKIYANLSQCLLQQRSYEKAAQAAREAQIYFPHESLSYIVCKEQEFFACFYRKNYMRCREALDVMLSFNKSDSGRIRLDKYTYYSGCLDFAEGKFKDAKLISNLSMQLQKDKSGWDLGIRYLKIMSLIELGELEEARNAIESLRKQIRRGQDNEKVEYSMRDQYIYKALVEYRNQNFEGSSIRLNYLLRKLGLKLSDVAWKYHTHEIIPVHKWMLNRLKTQSPVAEEMRIKVAN